MVLNAEQDFAFLKGRGEMGKLISGKDWKYSAVGSSNLWPQSLRTSLNIILNSQFPMFIWWGPEFITFYNDAYRIIAGEKHPEAVGKPGKEVWAEIWDVVGPLADRVMKEGTSTWAEDQLLYINRRGFVEESYFTFSYSPVYDDSGAVGGVFCACTETTEKVLSARKIEESEKNLRNTILQAPVAMCILRGPEFNVEIANDLMFELWGRGAADLLNKPIFEGLPESREQGLEELLQHVYSTGQTFVANERPVKLPRKNEIQTIYINFVYEPFVDSDGTVSGIIAVAIDVTEQVIARKKIEQSEQELQVRVKERTSELEKQNNLLDNILINSSNGISVSEMIRDENGKIIDATTILANDAAVKFTGLPKDIYLSKTAVEIDPNLIDSEYYQMCVKTLETGEASITQYFLEITNRWLELTVSKMDDDHLIHIFTDVTPMKEAQLQLERTIEELRRSNINLEEFVYAASHDLKEPIRKIQFFSDRLKDDLKEKLTENQTHIFTRMEKAAQRMGALIDDLLTYSHVSKGAVELEDIDLNKKVKNVLEDLELEVQEKEATVTVDELPTIKGHRRQLQQLFQNLIGNALKYRKADVKPEIKISYKLVKGRDSGFNLNSEEGNKMYHLILVSDNGIGFPQKDAERIFNVFTRLHGNAEYKGTGVGLSIARKVAENHHGYISAESEPGKGSTFKFMIPAE